MQQYNNKKHYTIEQTAYKKKILPPNKKKPERKFALHFHALHIIYSVLHIYIYIYIINKNQPIAQKKRNEKSASTIKICLHFCLLCELPTRTREALLLYIKIIYIAGRSCSNPLQARVATSWAAVSSPQQLQQHQHRSSISSSAATAAASIWLLGRDNLRQIYVMLCTSAAMKYVRMPNCFFFK